MARNQSAPADEIQSINLRVVAVALFFTHSSDLFFTHTSFSSLVLFCVRNSGVSLVPSTPTPATPSSGGTPTSSATTSARQP
jgi:hypothetical protein